MFTFILYNFSERTLKYLKKKLNQSFLYKNFKERTSKVAHNRPRPQPTAQNWFLILWNLGTRHLFSYLWSSPCISKVSFSFRQAWTSSYCLFLLFFSQSQWLLLKLTKWVRKFRPWIINREKAYIFPPLMLFLLSVKIFLPFAKLSNGWGFIPNGI